MASARSQEAWNRMPINISESTETPTTGSLHNEGQTRLQSGWLSIMWGDGLDGSSQTVYTLTDDNGQTTVLSLDETLAQSLGGVLSFNRKYVNVQGVWAAPISERDPSTVLNVTSISIAPPPGTEVLGGEAVSAVTGSKPWVSIMCKFSDHAEEPKDLAYFQGMYASTKPGLDHYWREQSYNAVNVAGSSAYGWFILPHPEAYYAGSDEFVKLANDCTAAADASVNFALFSGINLMFNVATGYASGGSFYMNLDGVSKNWMMTWLCSSVYENMTHVAHEMGHGFGLPHSSRDNGPAYDNPWDVMSYYYSYCWVATDPIYGCLPQGTISYHKDILGWIPAGQKFIAGQNETSTITLEQLALPQTSNYLMAQIPIDGSSTHFYTVEARRLTGYDAKLPGAAVVIHDVDTTREWSANLKGDSWLVGNSFVDSSYGISVYVASETSTGFQVTISTSTLWTISGYVRTVDGKGISGINIRGLPHRTTTDANGYYSDRVVNGWSGTVIPQQLNYSFDPDSLSYTNITSNLNNQNFTGIYQQTRNTILLVDDDDNAPDVRSYYTDALTALGYSYDVYNTNNSDIEPNETELANYDTVIWFSGAGRGYAGPGSEGQSALDSWLNGGGCFLLSSQDYEPMHYTGMLAPYLGWDFLGGGYHTTVTGAGSVFGGLGPYTFSYPFINNSKIIQPDTTAETAFIGDKWDAAVDRDGGTFRTAYLGFPIEAISSQADRQQVLGAFINWCDRKYTLTIIKNDTGNSTVTSNPAGIYCGTTCLYGFDDDAVVTLTALPASPSTFGGWSGAGCTGTGTCTINMSSSRSVLATFHSPNNQILTVSKAGTGNGTVNSSPGRINCGLTCSYVYTDNTPVTLTAIPAVDSAFSGWTGAGCSGTGNCTVTMNAAMSVTANFTLNPYRITVNKTGTGSGIVYDGVIFCGSACSASSNNIISITLGATGKGSIFTGWSSGGCSGTGTCTVIVDAAKSVTANFTSNTYLLNVSKDGTGIGRVNGTGPIDCGGRCSALVPINYPVTLTATPVTGSKFTGWSGSGCSDTGTCTMTMDAAKSVTANFTLNTYTLNVSKNGTGSGTVTSNPSGIDCGSDCSETYNPDTSVTLTATAATGSTFTGWSGEGCSGTGTCTVLIDAVMSVTANFDLNTYRIYLPLVMR